MENIENNVIEELDEDEEEIAGATFDGYTGEKLYTSPMKAIKAKCLDCCAYQYSEIALCTCTSCPLWPFRSGKNPFRKKRSRNMTEEQKDKLRERLAKGREARKNKEGN